MKGRGEIGGRKGREGRREKKGGIWLGANCVDAATRSGVSSEVLIRVRRCDQELRGRGRAVGVTS